MGKRIVITGSTRGIGNGLAREFLKRQCQVAISGRSADSVATVVAELAEYYGPSKVCGKACDITNPQQLQELWDHAAQAFGEVDLWINNAGVSIGRRTSVGSRAMMNWPRLVDTNLTGTLLASKTADLQHGPPRPRAGLEHRGVRF